MGKPITRLGGYAYQLKQVIAAELSSDVDKYFSPNSFGY